MRKKSNISFGPGAASLILIFVVLALSVLGMLSLMNGRNDVRLSERSVQVIEDVYALNERAEARRAQLDALLAHGAEGLEEALAAVFPEDFVYEDGILSWEETDGLRTLDCALTVQAEGSPRTSWLRHDLTAETEEI